VVEGQVQVRHLLQPGPEKIQNQNESIRIYANQPLAKARPSQGVPGFVWDRLKNAAADIVLNNPGGVIPGGGLPGSSGGPQPDHGKTNKPPPTTAPPAPPGGGN
jgi:hypothetical protein